MWGPAIPRLAGARTIDTSNDPQVRGPVVHVILVRVLKVFSGCNDPLIGGLVNHIALALGRTLRSNDPLIWGPAILRGYDSRMLKRSNDP